ncbi:hypothetical protein [Oscillibacter sp.]|uniref:hypothetical protein n=1 Tax=Oscillibacter sp. TaxID=1945593 RepID=UPI003394FEBD
MDCKNGIVTGVDVFPANQKESLILLRHLEKQQKLLNLPMGKLALDRGYDTGAVHRGLELLGVTGYIPAIDFSNSPAKYGFQYDAQEDAFLTNRPGNICGVKYKMTVVSIVPENQSALIRRGFGEEFWAVVATQHFIAAICVWDLRTIG